MKKLFAMCALTALVGPGIAADYPSLIPVVSKPVTKDEAIDLVQNGGEKLRVSREALVKGLAEMIAEQGGHNTGGENSLTETEVVIALKEATVVPCEFNKGEVTVFSFRRDDHSKMDGFARDSRPGEQCLSYKGARIISLACMNPLRDKKPVKSANPTATASSVTPPSDKPAAASQAATANTEWKVVESKRLSDGVVTVPGVAVTSGNVHGYVNIGGCVGYNSFGCGFGYPGWGNMVFSSGGNSGTWNQVFSQSNQTGSLWVNTRPPGFQPGGGLIVRTR